MEPRISSLEKLSFLSPWKILQALPSSQLLFSHIHKQSYMWRQIQYSAVLLNPHLTTTSPNTVLPLVGQSRQWSSLQWSWRARPSQQRRGGRGQRVEEVASPGMHGSRQEQTCIIWFPHSIPYFLLRLSPFCLPPFIPSFYFHFISSSLPSFFRLLMPYCVRALSL